MLVRDEAGVAHVVALSGGHDRTALAFLLKEQQPDTPFNYVCTPTGDELPSMFAFWRELGQRLGRPLLPIMETSLKAVIASEEILPNFRARYCTRMTKIEPYRRFLKAQTALGIVISYVGLRADEVEKGGTYRTPGRDSWPTALIDLAAAFEAGRIPTVSLNRMARERQMSGGCRVCSL